MSAGDAAAQERRQRVVDAWPHRLQRELDRHDGLQQAHDVPGDDVAQLPSSTLVSITRLTTLSKMHLVCRYGFLESTKGRPQC